ncbi:MAG TPA: sigma 54-interacting transcriptional regulator [Candidatus Omnitrophota bacterium]|nr:sigma 54-interacting transcriptional regulator [Candidatus Omnitrophota bacterium]
MAGLFRTCSPARFCEELDGYEPRSSSEHTRFHLYQGWALYDDGAYKAARVRLVQALRSSTPRSGDRSLIHGLLAESHLRVGDFRRAEWLVRRALSEGCEHDADNFLHAGHLLSLGRVQALSGHVAQGIETCHYALDLLKEASPHWTPAWIVVAQGHFYRGAWMEADAALSQARKGRGSRQQAWGTASVECPVALARGDVDGADRVTRDVVSEFWDTAGARLRLIFMEMQAAVLNARGRHGEAEALLRAILSQAVLGGSNSDAVASASRRLAESLLAQDRYGEAIDACRVAARAGVMDDHVEWVTALRIKGECLLALGKTEPARRTLLQAAASHATTQYDVERGRLEASTRQAAFRSSIRVPGLPAHVNRTRPHVRKLTLASGRVFVCCNSSLLDSIHAAARSELPVLIEGETGTGKELVAALIHELGPRSGGPWTVVDCTSLPEALADVELFGAARGAYTGAVHERAGLVAQSDGGTLLLDELPELPRTLQAKLLRVVQECSYRRVGEDRQRRVRARFIATTNRNVQELLERGDLKDDLYYRLSGHRINLRPLRFRRDEIGPLAIEAARRAGLGGIRPQALELLEGQPWPGNVRQLEMTVRLASASCRPGALLGRSVLQPLVDASTPRMDAPSGSPQGAALRAHRVAAERSMLEKTLAEHGGVVTRAASALGISRQCFYKALRRTGLR